MKNTYKDAIEILKTCGYKTHDELVDIIYDIAKISPSSICKTMSSKTYDIALMNHGEKKIECIKAIRAVTGKGLKESKEFSESTPARFDMTLDLDAAEKIKSKFEEIGAIVKIV